MRADALLRLYNALLPPAGLALRLASPWNSKLRAGLAGRRGATARLVARGAELGGRVVWFHTTSVGEYEQARPVAALLRARRPDLEILHTFFSPSGYEYALRLGEARHMEYLPEDTAPRIARVLEALQPRLVVFVKFDLWPNLVVEAHRRGIPVLLLDGTLQPRSRRSRWPARTLYRELYRRLAYISAVSEADAARFRRVVPEHPAIVVDGDTRFDQVVHRRQAARSVPIAVQLRVEPRPFTCIAGSTWGPDEACVVPAWRALCEAWRGDVRPRLLLVPHEPTPARLGEVEEKLRAAGLTWRRYSALAPGAANAAVGTRATHAHSTPVALSPPGGEQSSPVTAGGAPVATARTSIAGANSSADSSIESLRATMTNPYASTASAAAQAEVIVVDRVGVLAELYAWTDAAYVGGAFTTGVHNVMEPASMGLPVFFGPRHHNAPEAEMLLEAGAAGVVRSPADLERAWSGLAADPGARTQMGARARTLIEANLGASERCLQRILTAL